MLMAGLCASSKCQHVDEHQFSTPACTQWSTGASTQPACENAACSDAAAQPIRHKTKHTACMCLQVATAFTMWWQYYSHKHRRLCEPFHTNASLTTMQTLWTRFIVYVRRHFGEHCSFNTTKCHAQTHAAELIKQLGVPLHLSTNFFEASHKTTSKRPYAASNKKKKQVSGWGWFRVYVCTLRASVSCTCCISSWNCEVAPECCNAIACMCQLCSAATPTSPSQNQSHALTAILVLAETAIYRPASRWQRATVGCWACATSTPPFWALGLAASASERIAQCTAL